MRATPEARPAEKRVAVTQQHTERGKRPTPEARPAENPTADAAGRVANGRGMNKYNEKKELWRRRQW